MTFNILNATNQYRLGTQGKHLSESIFTVKISFPINLDLISFSERFIHFKFG